MASPMITKLDRNMQRIEYKIRFYS